MPIDRRFHPGDRASLTPTSVWYARGVRHVVITKACWSYASCHPDGSTDPGLRVPAFLRIRVPYADLIKLDAVID